MQLSQIKSIKWVCDCLIQVGKVLPPHGECVVTTYKRRVSAFQRAGALLPPGPPQQEAQQIQDKHGGLGECAEEGFVVLLPSENVLQKESREANC